MKPKNDGTILSVRVKAGTHILLHRILARYIETGTGTAQRTKAAVIDRAVESLAVQLGVVDDETSS